LRTGRISQAAFDGEADRAIEDFLRLQEEVGVDIVTDGEQRRDNFLSFVATKLDGVRMMTLAEMMEIIEDKAGFERMHVRQLVLEYATERAGDPLSFEGKELGMGVVNPRVDEIESPEEIRAKVERALQLYPAERLFLNPDCGFGTFANRPMNTEALARRKLESMVAAARSLRGALAGG